MHNNRQVSPSNIVRPIESLEFYFRTGGMSIIQAAFSHSFFVHPEAVREKTPFYPDRARYSKTHYPNAGRGQSAKWSANGHSRLVTLDDNRYAHSAWTQYTGCPMQRGSGYGLRHIWGHPWDPDAFTAGWNLCYMPFWAGMLTEDQHPLPELQLAIKQASWYLYFRNNPVCEPPEFVKDPGEDLREILGGQPLLIMLQEVQKPVTVTNGDTPNPDPSVLKQFDKVKAIRLQRNQSWVNLYKGSLALQQKPHKPFGTPNVQARALSDVRKILKETKLTAPKLQTLLEERAPIEDQMS